MCECLTNAARMNVFFHLVCVIVSLRTMVPVFEISVYVKLNQLLNRVCPRFGSCLKG